MITLLKDFASFVYLAQVPALDINALFISADHQNDIQIFRSPEMVDFDCCSK